MVSSVELTMARYDYRCPCCDMNKLSEFSIEEIKTDEPTGNQEGARESLPRV
jgi:hypothetical protein